MDYESLTRAQRKLYEDATSRTHRREIEILLLDLDGTVVRSIGGFMGGSIQGDDTRTPVEHLEVDVYDPEGRLGEVQGRHRKYQLRVIDSRWVEALDDWVEATVFTGPLWDLSRDDAAVHMVAHGSELHAMGTVRYLYSVGRKARATRVIRDLLRLSGAPWRGLSIPILRHRLPERVTVGVKRRGGRKGKVQEYRANRGDTYWGAASEVAEAIDRDLFCDPRGRYLLRPPNSKPAHNVRPDQLLSPVVEKRGEAGEVTNTWHIFGPKPKGKRKRVHVKASLPARHPLSAESLGRNGQPREIIERVENKHIRTNADARRIAVRKRNQGMWEAIAHEVEMMPVIPWIRPGVLVTIPAPSGRTRTRVGQWTLPLGPAADPLVLGANRRRHLRNSPRRRSR